MHKSKENIRINVIPEKETMKNDNRINAEKQQKL